MYYLNSRYYDSNIGRFFSSDGLIGSKGNIISHNMYVYGENNAINGADASGYKWNWDKIFQTAAIAVASAMIIAATVMIVAPVNPVAAAAVIGGVSGATGQMISNTWNDEPLLNNVAGAAVGGVMLGLTGNPAAAGFANALVNQGENIIRNGEFNINQLVTETIVYTGANMLPGSKLFGSGGQLFGTGMYTMATNTLTFSGLDCYMQNRSKSIFPEIVINISYHNWSMTSNGDEVWEIQFD
jgi:hypothetical protein